MEADSKQQAFRYVGRGMLSPFIFNKSANKWQIAQDDDGNFEFRSIGGLSDDEEDDLESRAQRKLHDRAVSPSGGASTSMTDQAYAPAARSGSGAAPKPPVQRRESLDGETIFAVGEGDEWSDADDSDTGEHGRLTKKI